MDLRKRPVTRDPLGEALHSLRMSGAFYCRAEFTEPWGLTLPALPRYLWFHVVTSGRVALDLGDGELTTLHSGDLALVTHGAGHRLCSEPAAPAPGSSTSRARRSRTAMRRCATAAGARSPG